LLFVFVNWPFIYNSG